MYFNFERRHVQSRDRHLAPEEMAYVKRSTDIQSPKSKNLQKMKSDGTLRNS